MTGSWYQWYRNIGLERRHAPLRQSLQASAQNEENNTEQTLESVAVGATVQHIPTIDKTLAGGFLPSRTKPI
jgi:hypothetical protein